MAFTNSLILTAILMVAFSAFATPEMSGKYECRRVGIVVGHLSLSSKPEGLQVYMIPTLPMDNELGVYTLPCKNAQEVANEVSNTSVCDEVFISHVSRFTYKDTHMTEVDKTSLRKLADGSIEVYDSHKYGFRWFNFPTYHGGAMTCVPWDDPDHLLAN